jgi:predicted SprT family Zn-dependent metalloprotease
VISVMSLELLSPDMKLESQEEHRIEDQPMKNIEQEIECPRCHDVMTLSSDFDKLLYVCQECDLLLMMK